MSKPIIKKNVTSAQSDSTPAVAEKKTRNRETVLIKVTASKLRELIGADTVIGVSRKELRILLTKASTTDVLAEAGL